MPPRFNDRASLVLDQNFASRVSMAAVVVALEVVIEEGSVVNHALRVTHASTILSDPISHGRRLTAVVLSDENVTALATEKSTDPAKQETLDNAIIDRLRLTWDALSGVATQTNPTV